jgi:hypothetical protein
VGEGVCCRVVIRRAPSSVADEVALRESTEVDIEISPLR